MARSSMRSWLVLPALAVACCGTCSGACSGSGGQDRPGGGDDASADGAFTDAGGDGAGGDVVFDAEGPPPDDAPFAEKRKACTFKAGDLPSATFGPSIATMKIPLDVIVVAIQENRAFDHYFWNLRDATNGYPDADVPTAPVSIPSSNKTGLVTSFHQTAYCVEDPGHTWTVQHTDYDSGKMDGFALTNGTTADPNGHRVLGWYDETDLPYYYAWATTFGVSDRHFCSVMGPTFPNRFYAYQGTSNGLTGNTVQTAGAATIFEMLNAKKISWAVYSYSTTSPLEGIYDTSLCSKYAGHCKGNAAFDTDAAAGKLPQVAFLDVNGSEHPPEDMQIGQRAVARKLNSLMASPQWANAAFILTYDENGGFYDHVPPASACLPDATKPIGGTGAFDRTGFRVPLLVASPYSKPHHLSHVVTDHTSILRFLELRFGLPALSARDANADVILDFFDFSTPSFATPPAMPDATPNAAKSCTGP
jgi:phospholipase C